MKFARKPPTILLVSLTFWFVAVGIGLGLLIRYENKAGAVAQPPAEWPAESAIRRIPGKPTLVMLVHPKCPCSRASIGELAQLMVSIQGRASTNVLFVKPKGFAEDWEKSDLWTSAAIIPGVEVSVDNEGVEARRFASETSGQVVLYGADGHLLFSGGITVARGHSGDNAGRDAIVALITGNGSVVEQNPVFGCPLFNSDSDEISKESCNANHGK
jgi:hypothetical protein